MLADALFSQIVQRCRRRGIGGYDGYFQPPIIVHVACGSRNSGITGTGGYVHPLGYRTCAARHCNETQEVVAIRCQLGRHVPILVSAYVRPDTSCRRRRQDRTDFSWLHDLPAAYPKDRILVGGDFNASHQDWLCTGVHSRKVTTRRSGWSGTNVGQRSQLPYSPCPPCMTETHHARPHMGNSRACERLAVQPRSYGQWPLFYLDRARDRYVGQKRTVRPWP